MSDAPAATELSPIAVPLAGDKLCKRVYKISKKGATQRAPRSCATPRRAGGCGHRTSPPRCVPRAAAKAKFLRRGVKEVVKCIRKGEKGSVPQPRAQRGRGGELDRASPAGPERATLATASASSRATSRPST